MAHLQITLLGPFAACLDDRPLSAFDSDKSRALLAYLAADSARAHPREQVADLLWPERPQGAALANLRHTLAGLRTAIDDRAATPPYLLVAPQTLQFNPAADAFVDLARFSQLLAGDAEPSVAACQEAIALCQGRFLDGFGLDDSTEFEAWMVLTRERVDRQAGQALARLVRHSVDQGDLAQAAAWTQRQLELAPWNEDAHRQLMWLLAVGGQRAVALRQFARCTALLADELDVEPGPATAALAARIRGGEDDLGAVPGLDGRPLVLVAPPGPGVVHHLPAQPTPFVGRARELAQVAETLGRPGCRLLTVVGPGGMGKTRLAVEAVQTLAPRFADGVWFVDLAPADAGALLPALLLKRLEAPESGPADARQRLLAHLAGKRLLLVLDNFEQLVDSADLVSDLLAAAPGVKVLVTSRAALRLREEWLEPLSGLELPPLAGWNVGTFERSTFQPATLAELDAFDATRLFVQCARRRQPDFAVDADDAGLIVHICRQLEGMPLAMELAAAWLRSLPLPALAAEVDCGLPRLETPLRDMPARHRSMTAVFDPSWRLLSEREQAILRALSVFRGGFTEDAARQVAGAELADLGSLVDASWLRIRAGRYDMHELVRQYCAARLGDAQGDAAADEIRGRHCAYFGEFLSQQMGRINYQADVTGDLMAEFGNIQAAWRWGAEHGQMVTARTIAIALYFVGDMLGWHHFVIQSYAPIIVTLERIMDTAATPPRQCSDASVVLAWIAYAQGFLSLHLGLFEQARSAAQRCHAAACQVMDDDGHAELLVLSGWLASHILLYTGEVAEAQQRFVTHRREFETMEVDFTFHGNERGRKFWTAHAQAAYAMCVWFLGDYAAASACWMQVVAMREEMGEQRYCAHNLFNWARACVTSGEYAQALRLAQRGLALSQAFGDWIGAALRQMTMGVVTAAQGQVATAVDYLQQSLAVGRRSGHQHILVLSSVHLGRLAIQQGALDEAQAHLEEALAAATRNSQLPYIWLPEVLIGLGLVALARGEHGPAAGYFQQALQQAPRCAAWHAPEARLGLAKVHLAEGRQDLAHEILRQVVDDPVAAAATRAAACQLL